MFTPLKRLYPILRSRLHLMHHYYQQHPHHRRRPPHILGQRTNHYLLYYLATDLQKVCYLPHRLYLLGHDFRLLLMLRQFHLRR